MSVVVTLPRVFHPERLPPVSGLEQLSLAGPAAVAAGLGFMLARLDDADRRLVAVVAPHFWLAERGRPYAHGLRGFGLSPERLMVVSPRTETETLWAMEEILRAKAASLVLGAAEGADLVAARRLDLAARAADASVVVLTTTPGLALSSARRRWRVEPAPSAAEPWDPRASGAARWRVVLERSRDGSTGEAILEVDHETLRLDLADRLADHGLAERPPARAGGIGRAGGAA